MGTAAVRMNAGARRFGAGADHPMKTGEIMLVLIAGILLIDFLMFIGYGGK
jgi:hypothetical protein